MFVRCFFVLTGIAAAVAFSGLTLPRESLAQDVRHMCSEKYQAAKAAGTRAKRPGCNCIAGAWRN